MAFSHLHNFLFLTWLPFVVCFKGLSISKPAFIYGKARESQTEKVDIN